MLSALQTSLSGLLSASNRAEAAADKIVKATARGSEAATAAAGHRAYGDAVILGGGAKPQTPGSYTGNGAPPANDPSTDLVNGIVDLTLAAHAYKANAVALKTADETLGKLLDDLS